MNLRSLFHAVANGRFHDDDGLLRERDRIRGGPWMALLLAGVTSLGLLMVSRANAGIKATRYVTINDNTKTASGSAGDARASANGVEYIGCYVSQAYSTGGADGVCHARNAAGVSRACHAAAEEHLIRAMRAVKSGSMVTFSWGDDGLCTYVEVINHSVLRPKTP